LNHRVELGPAAVSQNGDAPHAREIVGERGGLLPVLSQMQFQPFLAVSD
jgi:hypothetical protein